MGLTSVARVTIPRTLTSFPMLSALTSRTTLGLVVVGGLKYSSLGIIGKGECLECFIQQNHFGPVSTYNLRMSSGGYWLRKSLVSAGSRPRCSIISLCSMYTSKESLATVWIECFFFCIRIWTMRFINTTITETYEHTHISFFVLWQQLVDGVSKYGRVAFGVLTDALHQLQVLLGDVVQLHTERHLLPVSQRHLHTQDNCTRRHHVFVIYTKIYY